MASTMSPSFHDDLAQGSEFDFSEYNSPASISKKANFKTPSRRDSVRRMKALQATNSLSRSSPILPSSSSPIISQDAYVPLPTQPSNSSIHSGFTPGGPIPNNFSYLSRSNSLATSTRPNRPKGLERSDSGRSIQQQKSFSPTITSPSIAQFPQTTSLNGEPAPQTPAKLTKHRQSSSSDIEDALKRTMHARPPSVENILAELDAADAEVKEKERQSSLSRPRGEVSRRAAEYVSSISSDENELTHSTMRRVPKKQEVPLAFNAEIGIAPASEPRKPGAILPIESPSLDRVIPRRSHTLSSFPARSEEASSFKDQRSSTRKQQIAEKVAQLPPNPKTWLPSQVAIYLAHVLGFTPQPVVDDVTAFVRAARMTGNIFLRLRQDDLVKAGLNRKWQNLILESVKVLRRDCQVWGIDSGSEESLLSQTNADDHPSSDGVKSVDPSTIPPVDISALRAGYLQVAPTATSAMRGSVRRIKDRQAVKGMIQAFETWREADFSEGEEDAFVAINSGRPRRASHSGSIDSLDDDDESDEDGELDENASSVRQRRREVQSIQAIYGQGFVRRRAESYSSLSDAEHDSQAQIDAEVDGDRSISRARAEARRKRLASQQADDELVNAWIESLTDEEAQALANELEAKEILERGLLKPLIETAQHVKEASGTSSCSSSAASSTGSVRDDLKILLGSVNQATLAQHDLLSVVPSLSRDDSALSGEDSEGSPIVNLKTLAIEGGLVSTLPDETGSATHVRVPTFTPVSQDVLLAIFADNGADESTEPRMDQEIDRFLSIKPSQSADSEAVRTHKANPLSLPPPPPKRPSRYADVGEAEEAGEEDAFGTTRKRRQHASMPSGASELASLFPMDAVTPESSGFLPGDEIHATVKAAHVQNLSSTSSSLADDELEISETGSIRRRTKHAAPAVAPVPEEVLHAAPVEMPVCGEEAVEGASVADQDAKETEVVTSPVLESETVSSLPEWTAPSVRDIFGLRPEPECDAKTPIEVSQSGHEPAETVAAEEAVEEAATNQSVVQDENEDVGQLQADEDAASGENLVKPTNEGELEETTDQDEVVAQKEESQDADERPSADAPEDVSSNTISVGDETLPSNPSLTASKLPTPTLQAKRDASLEFGDVSGLDLNVDLSELEPIEPGGEKIPVPLTTLAPAPDGKGSIKKRSMVLVDRRRFESLARRMGALEEQLSGLETATSVAGSVAGDATQGRHSSLLRNMFDAAPSDTSFASSSALRESVDAAAQTAPTTPERQANRDILSSPEFADLDREFRDDVMDEDEDEDRWALRMGGGRTVLGAIPSYMLGLGAGIGFVIVSEVLQRAARFTR